LSSQKGRRRKLGSGEDRGRHREHCNAKASFIDFFAKPGEERSTPATLTPPSESRIKPSAAAFFKQYHAVELNGTRTPSPSCRLPRRS
jgi:hypothetical protein